MVVANRGLRGLLFLLMLLVAWAPLGGTALEAVGQAERVPREWIPTFTQVLSLHLKPGVQLPREETPRTLHTTHPEHQPLIALILDLLAEARLAPGQISPPVRGASLHITLQNGSTLTIRPAFDCSSPAVPAGQPFTCRGSADQVILLTADGREVRVLHPKMAGWLRKGWQVQIPRGEPPDLDRELAIAIAQERSRLGGWSASFQEEYPVERLGETEVRRAWLLETELPAGHKIRMVLDAKTGEVLRLVQLEALPGS